MLTFWDEVFNLLPNWSLHEISKFYFLLKPIVMLAYAISLLTHVCGSALLDKFGYFLVSLLIVNHRATRTEKT